MKRWERFLTDVVKFFQSPLLGFRNPEENEDESGDVETAIGHPSEIHQDEIQSS